jgi:DNA-binding XRE family transcriptional regulator
VLCLGSHVHVFLTSGIALIEILSLGHKAINRNSISCWGEPRVVTTRQIKAARALLGWSQADLAEKSGVSEPTVARLESIDGQLGGREVTAQKLQAAIERAGVVFLDPNGGGPGVRLRQPPKPSSKWKA